MRILITGGAGYVGDALIGQLETESSIDEIVIYDNLARNNYPFFMDKKRCFPEKLRFVRADILDSRRLRKEMSGIDVVIHLAAKVTTPFADHHPHEFDQINRWGTAQVCDIAEENNVPRFIYTSSASVYGAGEQPVDAHTEPHPRTAYGISKYNGEAYVNRLRNTDIYVLRLGNVYGYGRSMRFDAVINKFLFEAHFHQRIRILGDGSQLRSFIYIDRLGRLLKDFALGKYPSGSYNLVENTFTINDIASVLQTLYPGLERIYVAQNMPMRSLHVCADERINGLEWGGRKTLEKDLEAFAQCFAF